MEIGDEQAAVVAFEVGELGRDLADDDGPAEVVAALEALFQRLVDWRHTLAVEANFLDPASNPDPADYVAPLGDDDAWRAHDESLTRLAALLIDTAEHDPAAELDTAARAMISAPLYRAGTDDVVVAFVAVVAAVARER